MPDLSIVDEVPAIPVCPAAQPAIFTLLYFPSDPLRTR
jgi:hypothetical protein